MKSQMAMAQSMKGVSKVSQHRQLRHFNSISTQAMGKMNAQMKLPQLQKIMMDFEREVS